MLLILPFINCTSLAAEQFELFFTTEEADGVPQNAPAREFDCSNTIYAVVLGNDLKPDAFYKTEVVWYDPNERIRERTPVPFYAQNSEERIWAWLKLHRPSGSALLSFVDPAAGMGAFIGEWQIKVNVNGKTEARGSFKVLC